MPPITVALEFKGYWRDDNKRGLPEKPGIYCVLECTYNAEHKSIAIRRLVYIGESNDVKDTVMNHASYRDWLKHRRVGNELCYAFAAMEAENRLQATAALIFENKPLENNKYLNAFPFDPTTITLTGKINLLNPSFTATKP
jgi:hypothetical protein